jgi:hypothetical protein
VKFSIRDLLLVTVIVALLLGLTIELHRHSVTRQSFEALRNAALSEGCRVELRYDSIGPFTIYASARLRLPNSSAPAPNPLKP